MELWSSYLFKLSSLLFGIGLFGMLTRRNAISMLLSLEIMINAGVLNLVSASSFIGPYVDGFVLAVLAVVLAAGEAAVGMAIFIALFKEKKSIDVDKANQMRG